MQTFLKLEYTAANTMERDCLIIEHCLLQGRYEEAQERLNCLPDKTSAAALYLQGKLDYECGDPVAAAGLLEQAFLLEDLYGYQKAELCKMLERYFRNREDYKQAYRYASFRMELIGK